MFDKEPCDDGGGGREDQRPQHLEYQRDSHLALLAWWVATIAIGTPWLDDPVTSRIR